MMDSHWCWVLMHCKHCVARGVWQTRLEDSCSLVNTGFFRNRMSAITEALEADEKRVACDSVSC